LCRNRATIAGCFPDESSASFVWSRELCKLLSHFLSDVNEFICRTFWVYSARIFGASSSGRRWRDDRWL
jgi:hypothetical protein